MKHVNSSMKSISELTFDYSSDIEFIWLIVKSSIYEAMSLFVPKFLVKHHHGPKWFNSDIRHHLKCLRTLRRKFKTYPASHRKKSIHCMENLLQEKLVQAKATFENKLIESHLVHNSSKILPIFAPFQIKIVYHLP